MKRIIDELRENAQKNINEKEEFTYKYGSGILFTSKISPKTRIQENNKKTKIENRRGIEIFNENSATENHKKILREITKKQNDLLNWNYANLTSIAIIEIREMLKEPLIIHTEGTAEIILILVKEACKADIIEVQEQEDLRSAHIVIRLEEGANITYCTIHNNENKINNICKEAICKKGASLTWIDIVEGNNQNLVHIKTSLKEEGASAENYVMIMGKNQEEYNLTTEVMHEAPYTTSKMLIRNILADNAKEIYRGKIHIAKEAERSKAYQKSETLLLHEQARCDVVPILEVQNDDVQCTHGATITELDEEQIFYAKSRGLSEEEARELIIKGFIEGIINKIPDEKIREEIKEKIASKELRC